MRQAAGSATGADKDVRDGGAQAGRYTTGTPPQVRDIRSGWVDAGTAMTIG